MSDKAYDPRPTQRSRALRNAATKEERHLWGALSNRKIEGVRFNRQVPIGPYICDFVARSVKLVVELDGGQHGEAVAYDGRRTRFLEARGYRVLRFWNHEVTGNMDGVVATILGALFPSPPAGAGVAESAQPTGGGHVGLYDDKPSPSPRCGSSPPAPAGGE